MSDILTRSRDGEVGLTESSNLLLYARKYREIAIIEWSEAFLTSSRASLLGRRDRGEHRAHPTQP